MHTFGPLLATEVGTHRRRHVLQELQREVLLYHGDGPAFALPNRHWKEAAIELYTVMRTTFAAREYTGEEIPDEVLYEILDHARFAPSGGNRQGNRVIVVRDPATREQLARLSEPAAKRYRAQV